MPTAAEHAPPAALAAAPRGLFGLCDSLLQRLRCGTATRAMARGAMATFIARGIGLFAGLAFQWAFARWLGVEALGQFLYVLSWLAVFVLIGKCGGDNATLKFVPGYLVQQQPAEVQAFRRWRDRRALFAALLLSAAGIVAVLLGSPLLTADWRPTLILALLMLAPTVLIELRSADLRAVRWTGWSDTPGFIVRPLAAMVFGGVAFALCGVPATAASAMLLFGVASLAALGVTWLLGRRCPALAPVASAASETTNRQWHNVAAPLWLLAGFNLALTQMDVLLLGWLADARTVAIYSVCVRFAALVSFGLIALSGVFAPLWSELYATRQHVAMQRLSAIAALGLVACTLPAAAIVIVCGRPLLLAFGPEFVEGYGPLVLLCLAQVVNAMAGPVGHLLTMSHHQRTMAIVLGVTTLVHTLLCAVLISYWSMWGAAAAAMLTMIGRNVILAIFVRRTLGIDPTVFGTRLLRRTAQHA